MINGIRFLAQWIGSKSEVERVSPLPAYFLFLTLKI